MIITWFPNEMIQIHREIIAAGIISIPTSFLERLPSSLETMYLADNCHVHGEHITNVSISVLDALKNTHSGNQIVSIALIQSIFMMVEFMEDIPHLYVRYVTFACKYSRYVHMCTYMSAANCRMYARKSTYVQGRSDRRARNPDNKRGVARSRAYVMDRRESPRSFRQYIVHKICRWRRI